MRYKKITDIPHVYNDINYCYKHLCKEDQQRFAKKFREQSNSQTGHTFMELILGAYLSSSGSKVRYDYKIDNETPDWCILDDQSAVIGIVEVMNFHRDKESENKIAKGLAVWSRENKNDDRLYQNIQNKIQQYKDLIVKRRVPYIIAICPDSRAGMNFDRLLPCLLNTEYGLFKKYQDVSGVLYFEGDLNQYSFRYERNSNALRKIDLPSEVFPFT